ncbi:hypothetical protein CYFUS_005563 [Cystobacter fuscus]|uniref:Lipoprotein n=1 Tax=Cystobacter fuscus TaxID=43 RepID=A0A250J886_9BACT|nr:hypothetical protein [Cystobacter fuscus]ATB40115.1 hypothetical protein CYFUS_005563 [Cystobacter fuscus]
MNPKAHHTPGPLLALLLALCACGSTVGTDYPGEPLLTLEGQMTLAPGTTLDGPVRIALVWYPRWFVVPLTMGGPVAESEAVVAEDQPYEGTFPANFRFNIYRPPSSTRWNAEDGTEQQLATGALLAYQDLNGNGKLDTIPSTGHPVDRVLGSTMVFDAQTMHTLVYTNMEKSFMPGVELKKGFNLLKWEAYASASLPLSTPIPLEISGGRPLLDLLVCQGFWDGVDAQGEGELCGISGLEDPDTEPPPAPAEPVDFEADVVVKRTGDRARVTVRLNHGSGPGTKVTLGGLDLTYNPETWRYELLEATAAPLLEGGSIRLDVVWGGNKYRRPLIIPGRVDITAPTPGTHVKLGSPFEVRWTRPAGEDSYALFVRTVEGGEAMGWTIPSHPLSQNVTLYDQWISAGPARLELSVLADPLDYAPDMRIQVEVMLEVPITIDP